MHSNIAKFLFGVLLFVEANGNSWIPDCLNNLDSCVAIVPSKPLLWSHDSSIMLYCAGLEWNPSTQVIFRIGGQVIYDSAEPGSADSAVTIHNFTAITYSNIKSGIVEVSCQMNSTPSVNVMTIPYLEQFTFKPDPKEFTTNSSFTAGCTLSVQPNSTLVGVDFFVNNTLDRKPVGSWKLVQPNAFSSAQFTTPSTMASLEVAQGTAEHPYYSAIMKPTHEEAAGTYFCRVVLQVPGYFLATRSNSWDTSGALGLSSGSWMMIFCTILTLRRLLWD